MPQARTHHETCDHAVSLDPEGKEKILTRLRRIEGQVRGIHKMVEEDRYCADVLVQIASIQESLRSASQVLLQGHLRRCVTEAVESHDPLRTEKVFEELTALFGRYGR